MGTRITTERGFTLLEVVIAVAIMVVAFASILSVQQGSLSATEKANVLNTVAMLAKAEMSKTEVEMENKTFSDLQKEEGGIFSEPYQDYKWKREIKEVEFPSFSPGSQKGEETGDSDFTGMIGQMITKFLSQAVREVTLTISWKRGSGEQSYTLTTYWVNLNHELSLTP